MFVDEYRTGETQTRKLGLEDFVSWLETKDPKEFYPYLNCTGLCAVAQYLAARDVKWVKPQFSSDFSFVSRGTLESPAYHECDAGDIVSGRPHTFGAALERAKAFLLARDI